MKKKLVTLLLALGCLFALGGFTACDEEETSGGQSAISSVEETSSSMETLSSEGGSSGVEISSSTDTETDVDSKLDSSVITFKTLTLKQDNTAYGKLPNGTIEFSFKNEITMGENITYAVSKDIYGLQTYLTKVVPLEEGANIFYVLLDKGNDDFITYTVTLYVTPMYTVYFNPNSDGNNIAYQNVLEGNYATKPTDPTKTGCTFNGWDFDFSTPITSNTTVHAEWKVKDEMSNFIFSSTATTCTITELKDKTVIDITIPNYVTSIGSSAFSDCSNLTSITIPDSVTSIGNGAFSSCSSLTSVTIPDSVTSIGNYAFEGCSSLTSVTIGNGVTSIGNGAFSGCSSLTSVTIGNGVTSIGYYAFEDCDNLTGVYITDIAAWCAIDFNSNPLYYAKNLYLNNQLVTDLVIPDGVTSIGDVAFWGCSSLTSVTIPDSVTSIGSSAFSNCSSLTGVYIMDIAAWCAIKFSYYDSNPLSYAKNLYLNNQLVTDLVIPDSVTSIGDVAFWGCSSLTSVTIPDSVTSIGDGAFSGCSSLTNITVEENNPNYASQDGILYNKAKTEFVHIPEVTGAVTIPNGVTSIGDYAFYNCSSLTSITIPDSVTSIGSEAFYSCRSLTSVTIGNGVTSIGGAAFYHCSSLTSITIPDSVTSIGYSAFLNCSSLTDVYITDIAAWCAIEFSGYDSNPLYYAKNLYLDNQLVTDLVIPDGVTSIGTRAFNNCSSLTSVTIPDGVTSIGEDAFSGCSGLTSITIPDSVTSIGEYAFSGCRGLTSVTIGNGVTSIGTSAFYNCSSLTSVIFEDTSTWYYTYSNYTGGTQISVTDPSSNAVKLKDNYAEYYWYKK